MVAPWLRGSGLSVRFYSCHSGKYYLAVSGLASDERPSLTTSSFIINPRFDSIEEQKKTIMTAISSIGDSILEWADPGSQIRGHTEVRRSVVKRETQAFSLSCCILS